jgi:hypothetical protein
MVEWLANQISLSVVSWLVSLASFVLAAFFGWFHLHDDQIAEVKPLWRDWLPITIGIQLSRVTPMGWTFLWLGIVLQVGSLAIQGHDENQNEARIVSLQSQVNQSHLAAKMLVCREQINHLSEEIDRLNSSNAEQVRLNQDETAADTDFFFEFHYLAALTEKLPAEAVRDEVREQLEQSIQSLSRAVSQYEELQKKDGVLDVKRLTLLRESEQGVIKCLEEFRSSKEPSHAHLAHLIGAARQRLKLAYTQIHWLNADLMLHRQRAKLPELERRLQEISRQETTIRTQLGRE